MDIVVYKLYYAGAGKSMACRVSESVYSVGTTYFHGQSIQHVLYRIVSCQGYAFFHDFMHTFPFGDFLAILKVKISLHS